VSIDTTHFRLTSRRHGCEQVAECIRQQRIVELWMHFRDARAEFEARAPYRRERGLLKRRHRAARGGHDTTSFPSLFACYHSKNATAMTWPLQFWNDSTQKGLGTRWYRGHLGHERRAGGGLTRVPAPGCMHIIRRRINKNMSNCIKLLKRY
jgi:hypothetical protein